MGLTWRNPGAGEPDNTRRTNIPQTGFAVLGSMALTVSGAFAQVAGPAGGGRSFSIVPRVSATQSFTDNVELAPSNRQADSVTQLTPGVRITSASGRVLGFLDYAPSAVIYARSSEKSEIQHALSANFNAEALENFAYVDVSATVSQQSVSAFGTQSTVPTAINDNRTEVATYTVSPFVRGRLAGLADYEVRLTRNASRSGAGSVFNSSVNQGTARLTGVTSRRAIGWSANASHQEINFSETGKNTVDRLRFDLLYTVTPELQLSANGGGERNDLLAPAKESAATYGGGLVWRPNDRTTLSAQQEERLFGSSHNIRFDYRTPRTVWTFSDSRGVSTGSGAGEANLGSLYNLLFAQFASQQPDPTLRAQLVEQFLRANNLDRNLQVRASFLRSSISLERSQQLSVAWLGLRDTVTLSAFRSSSQAVVTNSLVTGDFADSRNIRQRGLTLAASHRLTPDSAINLTASTLKSTGDRDSLQTTLNSVTGSWSGRLGPRTSVSLGARYSKFEGASSPYEESAVFGSVSREF